MEHRGRRAHGHRARDPRRARLHRQLPGDPDLGPHPDVQLPHQRLGRGPHARQGEALRRAPRGHVVPRARPPERLAHGAPRGGRGPLHHLLLPLHPRLRRRRHRALRRLVRLLRLGERPRPGGLRGGVRLPPDRGGLRRRRLLQLPLPGPHPRLPRLDRLPAALRVLPGARADRRRPRPGQGGDDVPGRQLDRHRALRRALRHHRPGRRRRLGRIGGDLPDDRRHPARALHRGPVPAVLLPRCLPPGRRSRLRGQPQLAGGPARHRALPPGSDRLRRLPVPGRGAPRFHRPRRADRRGVPLHPRALRGAASADPGLQGRGHQLLGPPALLDDAYGRARPVVPPDLHLPGGP